MFLESIVFELKLERFLQKCTKISMTRGHAVKFLDKFRPFRTSFVTRGFEHSAGRIPHILANADQNTEKVVTREI